MMNHSLSRSGFTLVELSIVLVIVGLLAGGILIGRELIWVATLRSATAQIQQFQTSMNAFRDRYGSIPGDLKNASEFWLDANIIDGNGDGKLGDPDLYTSLESYNAWHHLALSGLYPNNIVPVSSLPAPVSWESPRGSITGTFVSLVYDATYTKQLEGNHLTITRWPHPINANAYLNLLVEQVGVTPSGIMPQEAAFIDSKIDDGAPLTGQVVSALAAAGDDDQLSCPVHTGENAYRVDSQWGSCGLWVDIMW